MAQRLPNNKARMRSLIKVSATAATFFGGICIYQGNDKFYNQVALPLVHLLDPENAHNIAIKALQWGIVPKQKCEDMPCLRTNVWGLKFENPIGIAAGFDKQAEAVEGLHNVGFSFVEIGSVTPQPQPGNPKPRIFRLSEDKAIINRYGFNSEGHNNVKKRLIKLKENKNFQGIIGVNLGKNKLSEDATQDYVMGIKEFSHLADYFVINVSSPNTPGLRNLQNKKFLKDLLLEINKARKIYDCKQPLLLKLAPDLTDSEKQDIADVVQSGESRVDGLILCNTTIERPLLQNTHKDETGGLSGAPLTDKSTAIIADMYKRTKGTIPIIGVGGIFSGEDAYKKIKAGASLVQIYTSFIYGGPPLVTKIKKELNTLLTQDGYSSIASAVGKDNIR